jgi:tRNA threonylcarbamoyladenosine biosynthesis protein TsaE
LGRELAHLLKGGETIELKGDLGAGKTTLVQGMAAGMGFEGEVTSPTFTLSREYDTPSGLRLYHFDLYRLQGHDIVSEELEEVIGKPGAVVVVEWADHGEAELGDHLNITLAYGEKEEQRNITVTARGDTYQSIMTGLRHVFST